MILIIEKKVLEEYVTLFTDTLDTQKLIINT